MMTQKIAILWCLFSFIGLSPFSALEARAQHRLRSYESYPSHRNMFTDFALISIIVGNESFIKDAVGAEFCHTRSEAESYEDCIYHENNHFYWKRSGKIYDSYELGWQLSGSASLCQTFAQMGYLGDTKKFRSVDRMDGWVQNAQVALQFWKKHVALILAYWDGVIDVTKEPYKSVFLSAKKPSLSDLRRMIRVMSSKDHLEALLVSERIE